MKKVTLLFMSLLCALAVAAQIRGNEIRVIVSPDHTDWNYRPNAAWVKSVLSFKSIMELSAE